MSVLQVTDSWRPCDGLVDSEDESWLNQPKFKLSNSDSDSDSDGNDFDSEVNVAYMQAVAAIKKVIDVEP